MRFLSELKKAKKVFFTLIFCFFWLFFNSDFSPSRAKGASRTKERCSFCFKQGSYRTGWTFLVVRFGTFLLVRCGLTPVLQYACNWHSVRVCSSCQGKMYFKDGLDSEDESEDCVEEEAEGGVDLNIEENEQEETSPTLFPPEDDEDGWQRDQADYDEMLNEVDQEMPEDL